MFSVMADMNVYDIYVVDNIWPWIAVRYVGLVITASSIGLLPHCLNQFWLISEDLRYSVEDC